MKVASACFVALCAGGLALAWHNRFIQDDAFISFIYARQLVEGHGLTWFGTPVEGYTNFLWVLWIALGLALRFDPIVWAHLGSLASFVVAVYALWRLSARVFDMLLPRVAAIGLFITNYTVSAYATGGLETMLQTALLCTAVWQFYELRCGTGLRAARLVMLALLLAAAALTRPDSFLPAGIIVIWSLVVMVRRRTPLRMYVFGTLPLVLIVGTWLIWKQVYYGDVLPNAFHAKVGYAPATLINGTLYLGRFLNAYLLWPFLLLALGVAMARRRSASPGVWPLWVVILSWCGYVVAVGGDFMEFRFFVPIAPYLYLVIASPLCVLVAPRRPRARILAMAAGCATLIGVSYHHARTFTELTEDKCLDSIHALATFYGTYDDGKWNDVGEALQTQLSAPDVVLASHAVGAIPYYSRLRTVDMLGLNDRWIARHGNRSGPGYRRPGHQVQATLDYLRQCGVNLVLGDPHPVPRTLLTNPALENSLPSLVRSMLTFSREPIGYCVIVAMRVDESRMLFMWYLTPHPRVEQLIRSGQWQAWYIYVPTP